MFTHSLISNHKSQCMNRKLHRSFQFPISNLFWSHHIKHILHVRDIRSTRGRFSILSRESTGPALTSSTSQLVGKTAVLRPHLFLYGVLSAVAAVGVTFLESVEVSFIITSRNAMASSDLKVQLTTNPGCNQNNFVSW